MGNRYVNVVITRQTQAVSQQGFGMPLIVSTEKQAVYKEYSDSDLAEIGVDFGEDSETYKVAAKLFGQSPKIAKVAVLGIEYVPETDEPSKIVNELNSTILKHNDFYYVVQTSTDEMIITAIGEWAGANKKLHFASTNSKVLGGTLNLERTVLLVHDKPESYPAEAWVGAGAAREIGSFTWTFKTLSGIEPSTYSASEINQIEENNASAYIREGGVNITSKGVTTSGEYIDVIQGQDFIEARMTENVFGLLVRTDKVPYTTQGIAMIVAEVESTLKQAHEQGIIAEDADGNALYSVTAPDIEDISTNDKANRVLPNLKWTATIAGAVEDVDINGTLAL